MKRHCPARTPAPLEQLPDDDFVPLADPADLGSDEYDPGEAEEYAADEMIDPFELAEPFAYPAEPVVNEAPFELVDALPEPAVEEEPFELVDAIEPAAEYPVPEFAPLAVVAETTEPAEEAAPAPVPVATGEEGLYDCLAEARELALAARSCEDRSRTALYAAVGRAYDFSLAAQAEPDDFAELMADSGLTLQDRAPMPPVVKLVFGADYDKTRLTEYAAVLTPAHRVGIERGALADFLGRADGGLKGVVQAEREFRRADGGDVAVRETPREALARKLRAIAPLGFEDIETDGEEFALVMIRRVGGEVVVLGEIAETALVEKAAKKLVA